MEAVGRFASDIAHDFNNILGAILGCGEIAQKKAGDGRAIADALDQVMRVGHRGRRLVEHILAFSRCAAGDRSRAHVQSVVDEALRLLEASLPEGCASSASCAPATRCSPAARSARERLRPASR
jgi:signal transduction histidine kinase